MILSTLSTNLINVFFGVECDAHCTAGCVNTGFNGCDFNCMSGYYYNSVTYKCTCGYSVFIKLTKL